MDGVDVVQFSSQDVDDDDEKYIPLTAAAAAAAASQSTTSTIQYNTNKETVALVHRSGTDAVTDTDTNIK